MESAEPESVSISAASGLVGVPAPTIRSWERRYGIPEPDRTSGADRRYDLKALAELRDFRDAVAAGKQPKDAAALVKKRLADRHRNREFIDGIHLASQSFDPGELRSWLDRAVQT